MVRYERTTRVRAPIEEVWRFHSHIDGLEELTPGWMRLRVEGMIGPDGKPDPEVLEEGSEVTLSIRPFGIGPRQYWTSLITERERRDGTAYFRDEMVDGPLDRWVHTHAFYADGDETVVRDSVEFELPLAGLGDALEPFSRVGFEPMFRHRHRTTRRMLE